MSLSRCPQRRVLVGGSSQSGCQIADELHRGRARGRARRGRAPWAGCRFGDRDFRLVGDGDRPALPARLRVAGPSARRSPPNILSTGHGGGHDLHLRTLPGPGRSAGRTLPLSPGLVDPVSIRTSRARDRLGRCMVRGVLRRDPVHGADPGLAGAAQARPFDARSADRLDAAGFGTVIFAGGFRLGKTIARRGSFEAFDAVIFCRPTGRASWCPASGFLGSIFCWTRMSSSCWASARTPRS